MPENVQHAGTIGLPAELRGRGNFAGPLVGVPSVFYAGPVTLTATANVHAWRSPGRLRLMAFGWYCRDATGTSATLDLRGATTQIAAGTDFLNTDVNLLVDKSGIAFFDDTAATYFLQRDTAGGDQTDPETFVTLTTPHIQVVVTITAATVTDLNVFVMAWPTTHLNADSLDD